jgi:hypothetical protein
MKGLLARSVYPFPSGWTVPTGAAARWFFVAPPATAIVGLRANAYFAQRHHRWQVGLSNGAQLLVGCPATGNTGGICGAHLTADRTLPIPGSAVIYTEVFCASGPCPVGGGGWYGWASMTWIAVIVQDDAPPSIGNVGGELWTDRWIGGTRRVTFDASDGSGIKDVRAVIDGREMARSGRACDPTVKACPDWPGAALDVATTNSIADGKHELVVEAVDRGDNHAVVRRQLKIDNTPPAAPGRLALGDGDGWRSVNRFTVGWSNPPQDAAPIAGVEYRLCPSTATPGSCVTGSRDGLGLSELKDFEVPGPGEWTLTAWLRDEARNARPETAAPPVYLRFDPEPPALAVLAQDAEDPARVRVAASDGTSAIARGEIELRRRGTNTWRSVAAQLEPYGFSAMLDDEYLRDGIYELRARAWDAAGNERSTDRRTSGEQARVVLPLRIKTRMLVGKRRALRRANTRRGRRARVTYRARPLVVQGRRVRLRGRLTAPGGNPLPGVDVQVEARLAVRGVQYQPVATSLAAISGPNPGSLSNCGAICSTRSVISRSSRLIASVSSRRRRSSSRAIRTRIVAAHGPAAERSGCSTSLRTAHRPAAAARARDRADATAACC